MMPVLFAGSGAMILLDATLNRTEDGRGGLAKQPLRPLDLTRVGRKLMGFWLTIGILAIAYTALSEYARDLYAPFLTAALWSLPVLALLSPFYVAYVDRRQHEPDDAYLQLGLLVAGRRPDDWDALKLHALGWLVKGFFLPLMFAYAHDGLVQIWARDGPPSLLSFQQIFAFAIDLFYLFDVLLAVVAYTLTLQILGSSIRSVEPTFTGWAVCLVCYPPFVSGTLNAYLKYDQDGLFWGKLFAGTPFLYFLWGMVILILVGIYMASTVAFGLRFSNLTHRGIITSGPYRWTKHPAYLSKNLSWWLISVPFVAGAGWAMAVKSCLLLLGINLIYFLRAKTEERHLRRDPVYREYETYIANYGLLARLRPAAARLGVASVQGHPDPLAGIDLASAAAGRDDAPLAAAKGSGKTFRFWLALAAVAVAILYACNLFTASLLIDGVRWFWLDDDQMISMRYARNLVDGHGLVWNPGERVEGYTNFGWVMLMAAVHLLPLSDQLMPVAMRVVSAVICFGALFAAARLLERLAPRGLALTLPVLLILILSCTDVMFWAVSGFETILVTALHLTVVLLAVSSCRLDAKLLVPLALIPIVRSDGMHIWLGDAALIFWLSENRRQAAFFLLLSLAPFAAHLAFRLAYYGELLPNTYYLKVVGLDSRWSRGFQYVGGFLTSYSVALILGAAVVVSLWRRDVRTRSFVTSLAPPLIYAAYVGGDFMGPFRLFAHAMPEVFLWAVVGAVYLVKTPAARAAWLAVPVVIIALPRIADPLDRIVFMSRNGDPYEAVVAAAVLKKNASPDATVAVIGAGILPYYTHLKSIDLLGKNDPHIARLPPRAGAVVGHGKIDPAYSFAQRPDYVMSFRSDAFVQNLAPPPEGTTDYVAGILSSKAFRSDFAPNPVPDPYLNAKNAVYVRTDSSERAKLAGWKGVVIAP